MNAVGIDLDLGGVVEGAGNVLISAAKEALQVADPQEIAEKLVAIGTVVATVGTKIFNAVKAVKNYFEQKAYAEFRTKCVTLLERCRQLLPLLEGCLFALRQSLDARNPTMLASYVERLADHHSDEALVLDLDLSTRYSAGRSDPLDVIVGLPSLKFENHGTVKFGELISPADFAYDLVFGRVKSSKESPYYNLETLKFDLLAGLGQRVVSDLFLVSEHMERMLHMARSSRGEFDIDTRYAYANMRFKFIRLFGTLCYLVRDLSKVCDDNNSASSLIEKELLGSLKDFKLSQLQLCGLRLLELHANVERLQLLQELMNDRMDRYRTSMGGFSKIEKRLRNRFKDLITSDMNEQNTRRNEGRRNNVHELMFDKELKLLNEQVSVEQTILESQQEIAQYHAFFGVEKSDRLNFFFRLEKNGLHPPTLLFDDHILAAVACGGVRDVQFWMRLQGDTEISMELAELKKTCVHENLARLSLFSDKDVFEDNTEAVVRLSALVTLYWGESLALRIPMVKRASLVPPSKERSLKESVKTLTEDTATVLKGVLRRLVMFFKGHQEKSSMEKSFESFLEEAKKQEKARREMSLQPRSGGLVELRANLGALSQLQQMDISTLSTSQANQLVTDLQSNLDWLVPSMIHFQRSFAPDHMPSAALIDTMKELRRREKEIEKLRIENAGGDAISLHVGAGVSDDEPEIIEN